MGRVISEQAELQKRPIIDTSKDRAAVIQGEIEDLKTSYPPHKDLFSIVRSKAEGLKQNAVKTQGILASLKTVSYVAEQLVEIGYGDFDEIGMGYLRDQKSTNGFLSFKDLTEALRYQINSTIRQGASNIQDLDDPSDPNYIDQLDNILNDLDSIGTSEDYNEATALITQIEDAIEPIEGELGPVELDLNASEIEQDSSALFGKEVARHFRISPREMALIFATDYLQEGEHYDVAQIKKDRRVYRRVNEIGFQQIELLLSNPEDFARVKAMGRDILAERRKQRIISESLEEYAAIYDVGNETVSKAILERIFEYDEAGRGFKYRNIRDVALSIIKPEFKEIEEAQEEAQEKAQEKVEEKAQKYVMTIKYNLFHDAKKLRDSMPREISAREALQVFATEDGDYLNSKQVRRAVSKLTEGIDPEMTFEEFISTYIDRFSSPLKPPEGYFLPHEVYVEGVEAPTQKTLSMVEEATLAYMKLGVDYRIVPRGIQLTKRGLEIMERALYECGDQLDYEKLYKAIRVKTENYYQEQSELPEGISSTGDYQILCFLRATPNGSTYAQKIEEQIKQFDPDFNLVRFAFDSGIITQDDIATFVSNFGRELELREDKKDIKEILEELESYFPNGNLLDIPLDNLLILLGMNYLYEGEQPKPFSEEDCKKGKKEVLGVFGSGESPIQNQGVNWERVKRYSLVGKRPYGYLLFYEISKKLYQLSRIEEDGTTIHYPWVGFMDMFKEYFESK